MSTNYRDILIQRMTEGYATANNQALLTQFELATVDTEKFPGTWVYLTLIKIHPEWTFSECLAWQAGFFAHAAELPIGMQFGF